MQITTFLKLTLEKKKKKKKKKKTSCICWLVQLLSALRAECIARRAMPSLFFFLVLRGACQRPDSYQHFGHFVTQFAALSLTKPKEMGTIWTPRFEDKSLNFIAGYFEFSFISDFDHALATHILGFKNRDFCGKSVVCRILVGA